MDAQVALTCRTTDAGGEMSCFRAAASSGLLAQLDYFPECDTPTDPAIAGDGSPKVTFLISVEKSPDDLLDCTCCQKWNALDQPLGDFNGAVKDTTFLNVLLSMNQGESAKWSIDRTVGVREPSMPQNFPFLGLPCSQSYLPTSSRRGPASSSNC